MSCIYCYIINVATSHLAPLLRCLINNDRRHKHATHIKRAYRTQRCSRASAPTLNQWTRVKTGMAHQKRRRRRRWRFSLSLSNKSATRDCGETHGKTIRMMAAAAHSTAARHATDMRVVSHARAHSITCRCGCVDSKCTPIRACMLHVHTAVHAFERRTHAPNTRANTAREHLRVSVVPVPRVCQNVCTCTRA